MHYVLIAMLFMNSSLFTKYLGEYNDMQACAVAAKEYNKIVKAPAKSVLVVSCVSKDSV